jgi:predicted pyridoxine 5'-phosphate oxidase superfamily flavin-nucleotide-binding protein
VYIQSLQIENLRTFETARIDFNVPGEEQSPDLSLMPNVNLLLGDNGSGKTSVLRAAALAALGPLLASGSGFVPFSLVRRVQRRDTRGPARIVAKLLLHHQDGHLGEETLETVITPTRGWVDRFQSRESPPWAEAMWDEQSPAFLVVGYGASRRVDLNGGFSEELRSKSRALRYSRVAGLFEEGLTLVPLSSWLPRFRDQDPDRHSQVVQLLNELLAPQAGLNPEPLDGEYLFRIGGTDVPLQALSDGYRAYVGWIADLLYHVCMGAPGGLKLVENRGVVLVDEVDLHLHPEWQQRVIPTLARVFPRLQFVFTSHSPLLVGTVYGSNVFVLDTQETDGIRQSLLRPSEEETYGLSADQILTSGNFGLASARNPEFTSHLQTQAHAASEGDPEAAIQFMRLMALGAAAEEGPANPPVKPAPLDQSPATPAAQPEPVGAGKTSA